jgi:hypothetical protein
MMCVLLSGADYFRRQAERCLRLAAITSDPARRDTLLSLAEIYRSRIDALAR